MGSDSKALIQRMRKWLEGRDGEGTWKKMGGWQNCGLGKRQNVEPAVQMDSGEAAWLSWCKQRAGNRSIQHPTWAGGWGSASEVLVASPPTFAQLACHARSYVSDASSDPLLVKPTPKNESGGLFL